MDGRRFRRWWLYGGLVVGAVGCHRNNYQDTFGFPKAGEPVGAVVPGGKPSWGGGPPPAPGQGVQGVAGMPGDVAPPKKSGSGFSAETKVAFADTWVESAFADPPPANRDQLIDQARQAYQKALQKEPKNKGALLGMARLYTRLGDREHALELYKKYLHHYPKDHEVAHEVAYASGRWKDWAGAAAWCDVALKGDPQNRTYRKTKGFCLAHAGKWEEAFAVLYDVMGEAQARFYVAKAMDQFGNAEGSRLQLQLVLKADPGFAPAREMLADFDQPRATPNAPEGTQVVPAGHVQ
jgi:hypothetical protein